VSRRAAVLALLLVTGCGGAAHPGQAPEPEGKVRLSAMCPAIHQVYDRLVASNPDSQAEFVDHLDDLRDAGDAGARAALDPVVSAAEELAAAGRGPGFSAAQDAMYQAVVGADAACRKVGSFILH